MTQQHVMPAFNALDGNEAVELICRQFKEDLLTRSEFRPHITYRSFRWVVNLMFEWSTQDIGEMGVEGRALLDSVGQKGLEQMKERKAFRVEGVSSPAPDRDRDSLGLNKPRPTMTSGGLVDLPKTGVVKG